MSVTKKAVFLQFTRGHSLEALQHHYAVTWAWLESALRKYMGKAHR